MKLGKKSLHFETAALTDVGRVRRNNEDRVLVIEKVEPNALLAESFGIYLIADGMGGHQAGEVASQMAAEIISQTLLDCLRHAGKLSSPVSLVKQAIEGANKEILHLANRQKELYSMGTTCTLGLRLDNNLYLGHVGDSRSYLIRRGKIAQLTEDHSLVAHLLKLGAITAAEARKHPERGKIFRCLGISDNVVIDIRSQTLRGGDSLVFCSDGLTSCTPDSEILDCVRKSKNAGEACRGLINLANSHGGEDNISVIVVNTLFIANIGQGC